MARIANPTPFSKAVGIPSSSLEEAGLLDPFINVDTQLFIDPLLLKKSDTALIRSDGYRAYRDYFDKIVRLLGVSKRRGDPAWRAAERLLDLSEPPQTGLGYGGAGVSGSSRPDAIRDVILGTIQEIVELGVHDPELVSLMGFFEDGVGPDTISDLTTRAIATQLATITSEFCHANSVPVHPNSFVPEINLPIVTRGDGREQSVLLVPRDILRDLPMARDWSEVEAATQKNKVIRDRVNGMLGRIASATVAERKRALKAAVTSSKGDFELFLETIKDAATAYDPNIDAMGYYKFMALIRDGISTLPTSESFDLTIGISEVERVAMACLEQFKLHVEERNLWEELWIDGKPKRERAAQLIFYAIADCFCRANNIDISPEANMGGGPVDFKFSGGYESRVIVELKRSSGTIFHGYQKQLEIYKKASGTQSGIFVVIDYGGLKNKLAKISLLRKKRIAAGELASEIVVIDARPKLSASKRQ